MFYLYCLINRNMFNCYQNCFQIKLEIFEGYFFQLYSAYVEVLLAITRNISRSENTFIKVFLPHNVAGQRPSGIQNHSHNPLLCYNQSPDSCTEHKADTTCMSYLYCTRSKPLTDKKATLSKYLVNSFNPNPQGIRLLIYQLLFKTILHHDVLS